MKNITSHALIPLAGVLSVSACLLAVGCGGSGSNSNPTPTVSASRATGSVKMTIKWPAVKPSRIIPEGAKSITITVGTEDGKKVYFSRTVARRPGQDTDEVTFSDLPVGNVHIRATAYPSADGSTTNGAAMATGDTYETVHAGQTNTTQTLTMLSTITKIIVAGNVTTPLKVGEQRTLHAEAYDATGAQVLTAPGSWEWIGSGLGPVDYAFDKDQALVTAYRPGSFTLALHYAEQNGTPGGTSKYNDAIKITVVDAGTPTPPPSGPVKIIDLGALPGGLDESDATGITNGQDENSVGISGYTRIAALGPGPFPQYKTAGFLWKNNQLISIGNLDARANGSIASGVSLVPVTGTQSVYRVVGTSYVFSGGNPGIPEAITFEDTNDNNQADPGELVDLGWRGFGNGINELAAIVGKHSDTVSAAYSQSPFHGQGNLPGFADSGLAQASAYDLNSVFGPGEKIVGSSEGHGFSEHPSLWTWNQGISDFNPAIDLGVLPGTTSGVARGISDSGAIAGYCQGARDYAFIWTATNNIVRLPDLNPFSDKHSNAYGINHAYSTSGTHAFQGAVEIVGSVTLASGVKVATLWTADTPAGPYTAHDINTILPPTSGWKLTSASAVNGFGLIVGQGVNPQGQTHAFLLIP